MISRFLNQRREAGRPETTHEKVYRPGVPLLAIVPAVLICRICSFFSAAVVSSLFWLSSPV